MRRGSAIGWAALDCLTCLILVIYTLIAPTQKPPNIPTKGYYAITQTCPLHNQDDVDLYVRDPQGNIVYFANQTSGLAHLEEDVIPGVNTVEGNVQIKTGDNERTILLGVLPGEYVVNEHMYSMVTGPEVCQVALWSIRDGFQQITTADVYLQANGAVKTPFRFTLSATGKLQGISHLPRDIVTSTSNALPGAGG